MWEKLRIFEVGLDMGFLENWINVNLIYYNCLISDKYVNIIVFFILGVSLVILNNGEF